MPLCNERLHDLNVSALVAGGSDRSAEGSDYGNISVRGGADSPRAGVKGLRVGLKSPLSGGGIRKHINQNSIV